MQSINREKENNLGVLKGQEIGQKKKTKDSKETSETRK